jgi:hypothetical protein
MSFIIYGFKEGSKILTDKGYIPIQDLRKGDLVKTLKHEYKAIDIIGYAELYNPNIDERIEDQLYVCSQEQYPEIFEDLIMMGYNSSLIDLFENEIQKLFVKTILGKIYTTDNKYRLPAFIDYRSTIYKNEGNFMIYNIALENNDYYMNYGIYANGLLVESCSKRFLEKLSKMTLIK